MIEMPDSNAEEISRIIDGIQKEFHTEVELFVKNGQVFGKTLISFGEHLRRELPKWVRPKIDFEMAIDILQEKYNHLQGKRLPIEDAEYILTALGFDKEANNAQQQR